MRPLVLLEFNELCPTLVDRFCDEGILPNFTRMREQSAVHVSTTDERPLEPWIQWVTLHTGTRVDRHGIHQLDEGHKLKEKPIWETVSDAGHPVCVFGAMNPRASDGINGAILPDPWSTHVKPRPAELEPFFAVIRRFVIGHTQRSTPLTAAEALALARFLPGHGIAPGTVARAVRQLVSERAGRGGKWRRAMILDDILWDVFRSCHARLKPMLSIFFSNSTAHFQHKYWRQMEPDLYTVKPSAEEVSAFGSAIREGYRNQDRLLGRALAMAGDEAIVVLATALSQQPCLKYEDIGGRITYRPHSFERVLHLCGVDGGFTIAPVMAEEAWAHFTSEDAARHAEARLARLTLDGSPALTVGRDAGSLFFKCAKLGRIDGPGRLAHPAIDGTVDFLDVFYSTGIGINAMHHPDGLFWMRLPGGTGHHRAAGKIPLETIKDRMLGAMGM